MAKREYSPVLFLNSFADCCFPIILISLTVLLYCISKYNIHGNAKKVKPAAAAKCAAGKRSKGGDTTTAAAGKRSKHGEVGREVGRSDFSKGEQGN